MKRSFVQAACCVALALVAGVAQAHGGGWRGGGHGHWHGGSRIGLGIWLGAPIVIGAPYYYGYGYRAPVVREYIREEPAYGAPVAPPQPTWYYCRESRAYYPYVDRCAEGWEAVPARPAEPPR
jgi:hypothetical protein